MQQCNRREDGQQGIVRPKEKEKERGTPDAQKFFAEFPDAIPGASKVQKFPAPGPAKFCLVHVLNAHGIWHLIERHEKELSRAIQSSEGKEKLRELLARMREEGKAADAVAQTVEADTGHILRHLVEVVGIDAIALEGVTAQMADTYNRLPDMLLRGSSAEQDLRRQMETYPLDSPKHTAAAASLREIEGNKSTMLANLQKELHGVAPLLLQNRLRIVPGDDRNTLNLAMDAETNRHLPRELVKKIHDTRQELLILDMVKGGRTVLVVKFGGSHRWQFTVDAWNAKMPEQPFALIEVTPSSFGDRSDIE